MADRRNRSEARGKQAVEKGVKPDDAGDAKGAKATTDTLLAKYPDSPAAQAAKKRQKK